MNNQFLGIVSLLIVIPAFLLQSCSEGKVEVEISVYGPADCGTSTQTLDNQTELKIWAFEKAFSLSEQDFKASKCIAGLTGKK